MGVFCYLNVVKIVTFVYLDLLAYNQIGKFYPNAMDMRQIQPTNQNVSVLISTTLSTDLAN